VSHWGHNVFALDDLAGCTGEGYTVYCMDDDGNWTDEFVSEVTYNAENNTVAFQAKQHGLCAVFPTS
jgi:hypothetical protein